MGFISRNSRTTAAQNDFKYITWIANSMLDISQWRYLHLDATNCMLYIFVQQIWRNVYLL